MSSRLQAPDLPLPAERSRVLSADTHLRPGRSAANRSLGGRWTLRLLPPAASREGAPPLPGPPPPPPSGPGPRPELWSPIHNARAGAMAIAGTSWAPTAGRAGRRGAARADGVIRGGAWARPEAGVARLVAFPTHRFPRAGCRLRFSGLFRSEARREAWPAGRSLKNLPNQKALRGPLTCTDHGFVTAPRTVF